MKIRLIFVPIITIFSIYFCITTYAFDLGVAIYPTLSNAFENGEPRGYHHYSGSASFNFNIGCLLTLDKYVTDNEWFGFSSGIGLVPKGYQFGGRPNFSVNIFYTYIPLLLKFRNYSGNSGIYFDLGGSFGVKTFGYTKYEEGQYPAGENIYNINPIDIGLGIRFGVEWITYYDCLMFLEFGAEYSITDHCKYESEAYYYFMFIGPAIGVKYM